LEIGKTAVELKFERPGVSFHFEQGIAEQDNAVSVLERCSLEGDREEQQEEPFEHPLIYPAKRGTQVGIGSVFWVATFQRSWVQTEAVTGGSWDLPLDHHESLISHPVKSMMIGNDVLWAPVGIVQCRPMNVVQGMSLALLGLGGSLGEVRGATSAMDDFSSGTLNGGTGDWLTDWTVGNGDVPDTSTFALPFRRTSAGLNTAGAVRRQYASDLTSPVSLSFDFTIDQFPTAGGNANQDRFAIMGNPVATNGSTSTNTYLILGGENLSGFQAGVANNWVFHDGAGDGVFQNGGAGENALVSSGIALVLDHTYRFTIFDDPANSAYRVSVDDLDTAAPAFTSGVLGYRSTSTANPFLNFGIRTSSLNDSGGFTVDNVVIIPEPSSVLLSGLGLLLVFRRQRS
jgi:hypothetical protein